MKLRKITPSHYPELKKFFHRQRYRLCAYALSTILTWNNEEYQAYALADGDTLIVGGEFATRRENRHLILPISPDMEYTPEKLRALAVHLGFERYWCVPGDYIERYGRDSVEACFEINEQKYLEDYIYATTDLAGLKGKKYSRKRNLIHQFNRTYVYRKRVKIEPITAAAADECGDFLEKWCEERRCDEREDYYLYCEKRAALNTLENIELLEVEGLLLRLDGEVSAFGIASRLTPEMGVLHFEKAFGEITGLYQYFDRECARRLFKGFKFINKESDMDVPGIARAKMSYHPVMRIKSYQLDLRR